MANLEIAKVFYEIADILELQDVEWKPRAYRRAAQAIETLDKDVSEIYHEKGIKGLMEIPGVGEALAKKIIEYLETKKIKEYEKLKASLPRGLYELMDIMGLGPRKIKIFYKKLHIKSLKDLENALKKHKIEKLEGFGEKSEENIKKAIELHKRSKGRFLLGTALPIAENMVNELKKLKDVNKINVGGSLRRMQETIGDIDILVTSKNAKKVMDVFTSLEDVKRVLAKGPTKSMVLLKQGIQADVRVLDDKSYAAALQYFTGNKEHNIVLRGIALKKGLKLSEYGLFNKKNNKMLTIKSEEELYNKLGLQYIEPELRQNFGEVEAAKLNKLPRLIPYNSIKGDLHVHSNYSDGRSSIIEMVQGARKLNYKYVAITDHSKARAIAHGLNEDRVLKQIKEIQKLRKKFKDIYIFTGTEVDIKSNGELDLGEDVLKKLDIVIGSIHSGFKQNKEEMTKRLIKAFDTGLIKIFGHPTTRIINFRPEIQFDFNKIFGYCSENNIALEIDSFPNRLDLKDLYVREAIKNNVKIIIDSDSHSIDHFKLIKYGIAQARRGWATKHDIINTYDLKDFKKFFNIK
ncbi:MAG: DNA polymerase/3'-5' exonuclease PolX [Nanoarchaeota archaeon]